MNMIFKNKIYKLFFITYFKSYEKKKELRKFVSV